MALATEEVTASDAVERWVWILHGFMGRGQNWLSVARRLCEQRPNLGCLLVDLRMHGESRGFAPPHTIAACVEDLHGLASARGGMPDVLVGHSFGGRVGLAYAPTFAGQLWVLDAAPASGPARSETQTGHVLAALAELPATFHDRRSFTAALELRGATPGVAAWLSKNLKREGAVLRLDLALGPLRELLEDHDRTDCWAVVNDPPAALDLRFVLAGHDSVLDDHDQERLRALAAQGLLRVDTLEQAGHWLHVDQPAALLELLRSGIPG